VDEMRPSVEFVPTMPNLSAEQPDPGLRLLRGLLTP
jgi:hypothetical protein